MAVDDYEIPDFSERVREFVDTFEATGPRMPLTHIAPMFAFRGIVKGDHLVPDECKNYREDLTYLFYGRPAYRAKQETSHLLPWSVPVLFVLDPEKTYRIRRVMPFDSGAFMSGFYGSVFSERSKASDFELQPSLESAQRLVTALYGDNRRYYFGRSEQTLDISDFDFELQGLNHLAKQPGLQATGSQKQLDERASAVEIQVTEPIDIRACTLALIVPETLLPNPLFQAAVKRWGLAPSQIDSYEGVYGPGSEAWVGMLYERVRRLYRDGGFL
jgi:hypothetical protein